MISRPSKLLTRGPGIVTPPLMARRPGTSNKRTQAAWRLVRWKKRYVQTFANLDGAIVPARTLAWTVRRSSRRRRVPGTATWARHVGRVVTFNMAVAVIHLAVLRWIFLPIGG